MFLVTGHGRWCKPTKPIFKGDATMSKTITGNWGFPTKMWFGPGRISELAKACSELGISRPLLVTDEGLKDLPIVTSAMALLQNEGLPAALYADVRGNPVEGNVEGGIVAYKNHDADGVIAFGGGSGLDVGKAVAFMVGQTRPIWDFEDVDDWWTRANSDAIAPIVAVPTKLKCLLSWSKSSFT